VTTQELLLDANGITKYFAGVVALNKVQLQLHRGEVLALIGENGAGKSTLMKILLGMYKPDAGSITFKGEPYQAKDPGEALRKGIAMIHQELTLIPTLSVAENIWIGRENNFKSRGLISNVKRLKATKNLLEQLGIEGIDPGEECGRLSIASMQLVEVARACSYDSDVIIMDEPTSAITNKEIETLFTIIRALAKKQKGIIFISHKLDELMEISDNITVFRDGHYIDTNPSKSITTEELVQKMVGRKVENLYPKEEVPISDVIFEAKDLRQIGVFENVNFKVHKGEILGFCGLMGAGRTEIMQAVFGITKLDGGQIFMHGKAIRNKNTMEAIKNGMAMVTEDRLRMGLIHMLSVEFNTSIAYLDKFTPNGVLVDTKKERESFHKMADTLAIKVTGPNQDAGQLSGGNQQKVIFAKWLTGQPDLLILDEPTRGIDVGSKAEIYKLIGKLAAAGKAVIVISSELPEVMGISDRIEVIRHGRIVHECLRKDFDENRLMSYAFGTLS